MGNKLAATCRNCGLVLSTGGGRCPQCGAEQPVMLDSVGLSPAMVGTRPPRIGPRPKKPTSLAAPLSGALIVLAAGALAFWWFLIRDVEPARAPAQPSATALMPAESVGFDAGAFNPSTVLVNAKLRALSWHRDAVLVSFEFGPVVDGQVQIKSSGKFEIVFGKPAGRKLGPGAAVAPQRLAVLVDAQGTRTEERENTEAAQGVAEPDCPFDRVWRTLTVAGLPKNARVSMRYGLSARHGRAPVHCTVEPAASWCASRWLWCHAGNRGDWSSAGSASAVTPRGYIPATILYDSPCGTSSSRLSATARRHTSPRFVTIL
jgi:hypothetical protein